MPGKFTKYQVATFIAVLFHIIGLVGILYSKSDFIINATPVNMILMFALLVWTQAEKNIHFFLFMLVAIVTGFATELIGVNSGLLFGKYSYGKVLGFQAGHVPLLIGINWFIIIYCSGIAVHTALVRAIRRIAAETGAEPMKVKRFTLVVDGAVLAVFFDWLMEPVATKLGYWQWSSETAPLFNYGCWFLISILLLTVFQRFRFSKHNKFAIHLLLIQLMFFLLLRTFL
ncbi:MAG: carotenoid biosynthesis protein [Ferruginibacter sp.]